MSLVCRKLCSSILLEHFGHIVQAVGEDLIKYGPKPLGLIRHSTHLSLAKIKEALCVLIKYDFVIPRQTERGIEYSLIYEKIIMVLRYPRYMFFAKTMCGDDAEMILEEVLKHGYITASEVIALTYKRIQQSPSELEVSVPVLKDKFELLVKNQFLMRSLYSETPEETANEKRDYNLPDLNIAAINKLIGGEQVDCGDSKIYWKVNFDRFTQDLRDQIIISAMRNRLDENASELMRQLLFLMYLRTASWADTSNPIPLAEIKEAVRKIDYPLLTQHLDQYLRLIEEDTSQFLKRVGDAAGGQYSVNMKEAFNQLAWTTLENIVMERFGSKAARIFRLVRDRKYIEQEQIQQLAMIPAKEAKYLTYTLLQENYLQMQEIKKAGVSAAPMKTFFLFHIDLNLVVHMEVEHCYHALYNTMQRREYEVTSNKRMIDKQLRMQTLTSNLKEHGATEEQLAEIAEMMTPSEKQQLEKVQSTIKKLGVTELQIDDTLFLLTMYLRYH
ncbi:PREDICTED: DNA-directed RNA polymerase III subunit RPC3 [Dufourea novaeangliae]|uniref:DNA-directed RNA polymerase III subunit RPC3 n=1 Tax=Dufourea novaeangliae TaxID=178035 RepID=A0A154P4H2_DUFNO|nr:PREDICTED: DNA-directed RNA polymerase III subunit RPC3 [Dufourea novaeangliae]KZC06816.1 DNA-directed RNA polymerase III subunit RPC3 [Dufourea novaeangliae]